MAGQPHQSGSAVPSGRFRVAFRYSLDGDLRYLSHRDELRMLRRALVRAAWPLHFSRGYNPMPWLSVPLPRRVGIASDCQWALTELSEPQPAAELSASLAAALPENCRLRQLSAPAPVGTPHPRAAEYSIELPTAAAAALAPQVRQLESELQSQNVSGVQGAAGRPEMPKVHKYLERAVLDGPVLRLWLRFEEQRTARPSEILTELGLDPAACPHAVRLNEVTWNMEFSGPMLETRASKGIAIGYTESDESHEG